MPELPEVTTIVNQLREEIVGVFIADVQSIDGFKTQPEFSKFKQKAEGRKVIDVRRIAKNIVIELDSSRPRLASPGEALWIVIHLAMTGRLLLRPQGCGDDPWTRLVFYLSRQGPALNSSRRGLAERELRFCDARLFGFVGLMEAHDLEIYSSKYGPDALDEALTSDLFLTQLRRKRTAVKRALLEQDLIAGVGNIYANDALWLAGIHPETVSTQVTSTQAKSLLEALRLVLKESIEHRGSTLGDKMYIDLYAREGTHQNYFRIFGKKGQACPRCGTGIGFLKIGGRDTFFCPECQREAVSSTKETSTKETSTKVISIRNEQVPLF